MRYLLLFVLLGCFGAGAEPTSKKTSVRKTQEVNFEETDIDGVVRSPDGAYLLQKRGVKFMPLYKVQKHFDDEIKNSVDYLR
ncbi:MAG: hypothetical protein IT288_16100 [Bdellovibrionales bacterium]|nr:hypothetical protein [Bdellovibrionales bacterium]